MINKELLKTTLEQTEQVLLDFRELIDEYSHFYIFPFTIQGCINVTEVGLKPETLELNDYTYFSKVIGGDSPLVATWEDSTFYWGKTERFKHMQNELGARKKYIVGRYFKGMIERDSVSLEIAQRGTYGVEMTSLQEKQVISLLTTTKLDREDIFKLYILKRFDTNDPFGGNAETPNVPLYGVVDRNRAQYLFISQLENYYSLDNKFIYAKVTFSSLNDRLADSGYSIASYVQAARAGEGYAWPMLEKQDDGTIRVVIDKLRTIDVGVWGCQIKIDNTAIIHSVRLQGFPVTWDYKDIDPGDGTRIGIVFAPRPLFPKYFLPCVQHPLNTQLKPEEKYLLVVGIQPIVDFYTEWKENKRSAFDENIKSTFEGHLRTNYELTKPTEIKRGSDGKLPEGEKEERVVCQIWKNALYPMSQLHRRIRVPYYPDWIGERVVYPISDGIEKASTFLDMPRSVFSNIFSRRLPEWGNVNERLNWKELTVPLLPNILALNSFAHHDILTLPMGINQTVTTETLDTVNDATSRIPVVGNILGNVIKGFHSFLFGASPSGFKIGGIDNRLDYYGSSMVGIMSAEMYYFYTGQYFKSLSAEMKGVMPLNAFQYQSEDPLSTMLSATANSTALNFKITDICETGVYDISTKDYFPKRVTRISTVHIGQQPGKKHEQGVEMPTWSKNDVPLVDNNFNLHFSDTDSQIVAKYGRKVDDRRLYIVNEVCVQAIGAGNITVTFFSQDPTIHGYEQVSIWEGVFRNHAKVSKSVRAWTTTIRFGQPNIREIETDENGEPVIDPITKKPVLKNYQYHYPRTILSDIQKRPNLPPEREDKSPGYWTWAYGYTFKDDMEVVEYEWAREMEGSDFFSSRGRAPRDNSEFRVVLQEHNFVPPASDFRDEFEDYCLYTPHYNQNGGGSVVKGYSLSRLVANQKTDDTEFVPHRKELPPDFHRVFRWGEEILFQPIFIHKAFAKHWAGKDEIPPTWPSIPSSDPGEYYWHAYHSGSKEFWKLEWPETKKFCALWYEGKNVTLTKNWREVKDKV